MLQSMCAGADESSKSAYLKVSIDTSKDDAALYDNYELSIATSTTEVRTYQFDSTTKTVVVDLGEFDKSRVMIRISAEGANNQWYSAGYSATLNNTIN